MMKKIISTILVLLSAITMYAELWVPVGVGEWHEGIITAHKTKFVGMAWDVIIEQSSERSSVFRMQPYVNHSVVDAYCQKDDVYVYVHIE